MVHIFTVFLLFLLGCAPASAPLISTSIGQGTSKGEVIQVIVKPITTHGFGSEDEKRFGLDLSAYFTAFDVTLVNQTKEKISFSPLNAYLLIEAEEKMLPLDEAGSIRYYREGDDPSRIVLIPKSKNKIEEDIRKIKKARLSGGEIKPGHKKEGLILFKKVSQRRCWDVVLRLDAITVVRTEEKKRFSFPFSCQAKP